MKYLIALSLLLSFGGEVIAQTSDTPTLDILPYIPHYKRNEIGLFGQNTFNGNGDLGMAGIIYKRWVRPNKSLRFSAAMGGYSFTQSLQRERDGDTLIEVARTYKLPMTNIAIGAEVQRAFYKKVILYAAVDLAAGWGKGYIDSSISRNVSANDTTQPYFSSSYYSSTPGLNRTTVGLYPYIGAKLQFKRFVIGTELRAIEIACIWQKIPAQSSYGILDFSLGNFSQRLYLTYRFD